MKKLLLLTGALLSASAANARLQIAFTDGVSVITCADGEACDLSSHANVIGLNETVGDFHIVGTVVASTSARGDDILKLSTSLIQNTGSALGHLGIVVGGADYAPTPNAITESASLPIEPGASTLRFFADAANGQPAGDGLAVPGVQLFTTPGTPDVFNGVHFSAFFTNGLPFSMTETADLALLGGDSILGFDQSMSAAAIPELKTWTMAGIGFAAMAFAGYSKSRRAARKGVRVRAFFA